MSTHFAFPFCPESELADCECKPWHHSRKNTRTVNVQKQLRVGHQIVEQHTQQQQGDCRDNTVPRNTGLRDFAKKFRGLSVFRQRIQHSSRTVNSAVAAGHGSGQHYKIDDARRSHNAHLGKGQNERTADLTHLIPRIDRDNHKDRAHVKNQNAPDDIFDRFLQRIFRVFCFSGRNPHQFNSLIGGRDDAERKQKTLQAPGKKTTVAV
ncbi:hypothetical protein D3C73_1152100 [compost metagenome]